MLRERERVKKLHLTTFKGKKGDPSIILIHNISSPMFFILFESSESKCFDPQITKVSSQFSPIILIPLCYYVITKNTYFWLRRNDLFFLMIVECSLLGPRGSEIFSFDGTIKTSRVPSIMMLNCKHRKLHLLSAQA